MKIEKFKVLLFLKKTEPDKSGKAPIMGRITLNRTVAQFREPRGSGDQCENREAAARRPFGIQ